MTTDLLDFPTIEAVPMPASLPTKTPVALAEPAALAAVTPSIKDTVLAQFKDAEGAINALAEKYRDVAYDVATTKGMNEAVAARADLRDNGRLALTRAEAHVKKDVNDLKRVMAEEVDRLVAIVQPVHDAIDTQIKAEMQRKAAAKAERDRIEAERVAAHRERLAKIPAYLTHCQQYGMTAARIASGIAMLEKVTFGPDWQEFAVSAANAQCETLEAMRALHAQAVEREAEALRQEQQRQAEADRLEAQRVEQERVAAELAEQRRRLTEMQAELDRRAEQETLRRREQEAAEADRMRVEAEQKAEAPQESQQVAPQQVLKAEPEMADATDRSAPIASPSVGSMGAGQAADAAPIEESAPAATVDLLGDEVTEPQPAEDPAQALADCRTALTLATDMLDELIVAYGPKRAVVALFARVATLRDMGGVPRNSTHNTKT